MVDHAQNRDPFADAFGPLYREGRLIDVPAGVNAHDREARRAEIVKDRVAPARPREEVLAELRVQRAAAEAFLKKADRLLKTEAAPVSQSAVVDAILAEEGVTEDAWLERETYLAAAAEEDAAA